MGRLLLAIAMIVGGCDTECSIEVRVAEHAGDAELLDCGELYGSDTAPYRVARQCVLDAVATGGPFRVTWHRVLLEASSVSTFIGTHDGIRYVTASSQAAPANKPLRVTSFACSHVVDLGEDCGELEQGGLCLQCADARAVDSCTAE